MSKITTTPYEIIKSEWLNKGNNEFVNEGRLSFYNRDYNVLPKIINFDKEIEEIVNHMFFYDAKLLNPSSDRLFKKTWIQRFMDREIMYQTVERFAAQNVYVFNTYQTFLNKYYDDLDKYLHGEFESDTTGKDSGTGDEKSDTRFLESSLPQNEINLNVDDTQLSYGDTNNLTRQKSESSNESSNESNTMSKQYNVDDLLKINNLLEPIYNEFDLYCFLQVW